jgi:putative AdoMet-dependent methyltransferase
MRSRYADKFNHDSDVASYDQEVQAEASPIRACYRQVLQWVIQSADIHPGCRVLDLGVGTGNLSSRIRACKELVGVDVSEKMIRIARPKLSYLSDVKFVTADLLEYFDGEPGRFDRVISTYAIHHLLEEEKALLFRAIWACLQPGGRAVFGDLMVETRTEMTAKSDAYRAAGDPDTADGLDDEFYWILDEALTCLQSIGFRVSSRRFSDLSFGIVAAKVDT